MRACPPAVPALPAPPAGPPAAGDRGDLRGSPAPPLGDPSAAPRLRSPCAGLPATPAPRAYPWWRLRGLPATGKRGVQDGGLFAKALLPVTWCAGPAQHLCSWRRSGGARAGQQGSTLGGGGTAEAEVRDPGAPAEGHLSVAGTWTPLFRHPWPSGAGQRHSAGDRGDLGRGRPSLSAHLSHGEGA